MKIPNAVDAEKQLIGMILYDPESINRISDFLVPNDFYSEKTRTIYIAMLELYSENKVIDVVSLYEKLKNNTVHEVAGDVSSAAYIEQTARIIKEKSLLRSMIVSLSNFVVEAQSEPEDIFEFIESVERKIYELSHRSITRQFVTLNRAMTETIEHIDYIRKNKTVLGIGTGFPSIDRVMSGLQNTDLITIAGRPGSGKTAIGLNFARNMIHQNRRIGFFSLEMSREQLSLRLASMESGVDHTKLRLGRLYTDDEWNGFLGKINKLYVNNLVIDDVANTGLTELRAKARRMIMQYGVEILFIDYLQIMKKPKAQSRDESVSELTNGLKNLAKDLNIPIVLFSQLNRNVESRKDAIPVLSDLRESGSIEQDSDIVSFVYRPEIHGIKTYEGKATEGYAEFIIAKNRHGAIGSVELYFKKENILFHEMLRIEENVQDGKHEQPF